MQQTNISSFQHFVDEEHDDWQCKREHVAAHCNEAREGAVEVQIFDVFPVVVCWFPIFKVDWHIVDERYCFHAVEHAHQALQPHISRLVELQTVYKYTQQKVKGCGCRALFSVAESTVWDFNADIKQTLNVINPMHSNCQG